MSEEKAEDPAELLIKCEGLRKEGEADPAYWSHLREAEAQASNLLARWLNSLLLEDNLLDKLSSSAVQDNYRVQNLKQRISQPLERNGDRPSRMALWRLQLEILLGEELFRSSKRRPFRLATPQHLLTFVIPRLPHHFTSLVAENLDKSGLDRARGQDQPVFRASSETNPHLLRQRRDRTLAVGQAAALAPSDAFWQYLCPLNARIGARWTYPQFRIGHFH